jgi:hypothetical protein
VNNNSPFSLNVDKEFAMARKIKKYREVDLIKLFNLQRLVGNYSHPLLQEWLTFPIISLSQGEQEIFDSILEEASQNIHNWHEEDLKMQFISFVLKLGHLKNTPQYHPYFERVVEATIGENFLKVKTDFMIASGVLDMPEKPYFHFQEWKRQTDPHGDPIGQVLEAMLIAQELNQNSKPIYGCYIVGKAWNFIVLEKRTYCISRSYDSTQPEELLKIIAILRHFKIILETKLLD